MLYNEVNSVVKRQSISSYTYDGLKKLMEEYGFQIDVADDTPTKASTLPQRIGKMWNDRHVPNTGISTTGLSEATMRV